MKHIINVECVEDGVYAITTVCPLCGKENIIKVHEQDYFSWLVGTPAQDAFFYLSSEERELLISGIDCACWRKMFPIEEED